MMSFEQHIPVGLQFRAMTEPIKVHVPAHVLPWLDALAERAQTRDGVTIYRLPAGTTLPEIRWQPRTAAMLA